jgi:hypothetical protein
VPRCGDGEPLCGGQGVTLRETRDRWLRRVHAWYKYLHNYIGN